MYIARVPGPGELRWYVNLPPPAGPPGSRQKVVLPRAHGPGPPFIIPCYRPPPRGGGARSGISPCYLLFRPQQPIFVQSVHYHLGPL
jgi:hypothetical protein